MLIETKSKGFGNLREFLNNALPVPLDVSVLDPPLKKTTHSYNLFSEEATEVDRLCRLD